MPAIFSPLLRRTALVLALLPAVAASCAAAADAPRVAASFRPLQSLAAAVMAGLGTPAVIIHGAGSPHTYAMRPSEARELSRADVVFWIGPSFESFLAKPIAALGGRARTTPLIEAPGVVVLEARHGGTWESEEEHGTGDDHGTGNHGTGNAHLATADPHIFLDPANAEAMVRAMAATLGAADPANRRHYDANAVAEIAKLQALDGELAAILAPVKGVPFVVFHDATQYFERRYGLTAVGSIVVSPERPPGARRIAEIRDKIETAHAACVFGEPQFESALVQTVAAGTQARTGVLDYVGVDLKPGADAYFAMMRRLAHALSDCLKR